MSTKVIVPPEHLDRTDPDVDSQIIFLAGPIIGARRWQDDAIAHLKSTAGNLVIANPRRAVDKIDDFTEADYKEQVEWESDYLTLASASGAILFWLAREQQHFCDRAFAQTSRFELGEWFGRSGCMVVGIEDGFPGAKYLRVRLAEHGPVYSTLEETCRAAASVIG